MLVRSWVLLIFLSFMVWMDSSVYISGYISGPLQEQECYNCELHNKKNFDCLFI
jgi:hypothetical protein